MLLVGTKEKKNPRDFKHRCSKCGNEYYFDYDCRWKKVVCPHCGHRL